MTCEKPEKSKDCLFAKMMLPFMRDGGENTKLLFGGMSAIICALAEDPMAMAAILKTIDSKWGPSGIDTVQRFMTIFTCCDTKAVLQRMTMLDNMTRSLPKLLDELTRDLTGDTEKP